MGELAKSIIQRVKTAKTAEDLEGWVWKASDLTLRWYLLTKETNFDVRRWKP